MLLLLPILYNFLNEIQMKEFPAGRICESRWIKHWAKMGLLFENSDTDDPNKWSKFSFVELIWLKAILKMRQFGLPLEYIEEIKNNLPRRTDDYKNSLEAFASILIDAILRRPTDLLYVKDDKNIGTVLLAGFDNMDTRLHQSHLFISINELIKEFILDIEGDGNDERRLTNLIRFNIMSEAEIELMELIRSGTSIEIIIEGHIVPAHSIEVHTLNEFVDIVLFSGYSYIKYTSKDKEVRFQPPLGFGR